MGEPQLLPDPDPSEVDLLFEAALRLEGYARLALLEREALRRPRIAAEVRSLLEAHDAAGEFLEQAVFEQLAGTAESHFSENGRRVGPYRIEGMLGRGGMGTVYRAVRENPRRTVALKVLNHPSFAGPERRARFEREAQMLARLQHPGIATLYETGTSQEGVPYIAMELVRGPILSDWKRTAKPSRRTLLRVFAEICEAVEYAHGAGVIHRDLKPANVIVQQDGERLQVKILDLGLALPEKTSDEDVSLTQTGSILGTPSYSSPEQVSGQLDRVGCASDVYSLGVILYELLTGHLPYGSPEPSLLERIIRTCEEDPVRPSSIDRSLRGDLETILLKALEKEPARRYASARAMRADVELYLAGRPILARSPSAWYQFRKLVDRNRVVFASACAIFVTVTGAVVALSVLYVDSRRSERRATDQKTTALEVNEFLRKTLSLADPNFAGVPNLGMHELLDRTAERIDTELKRNTYVAAQVRKTLGDAYAGLGDFTLAEVHLRRALTTMRAVLQPGDHEMVLNMVALGKTLLKLGKALDAAALFDEAIVILGEPYTLDERMHVADLRLNLALAVRIAPGGRERFEQAEELLDEARELIAEFPEEERLTFAPRLAMETASFLGSIGRDVEAEAELRDALTILESANTNDPQEIGICLNSLGVCLGRQHRGTEAEAAYRRASELLLGALGPRHPRLAAVLDNLGDQIARNGRPAEGEKELRRAFTIRQEVLPANHPDLAVTRNHLGNALRTQGKLDAAREMFELALRTNREVLGAASIEVANGEANLCQLSLTAGDADAAELHGRRALAGYQAGLPANHWWIGAGGGLLGQALMAQERLAEAEDVLREATSVVEMARGKDDPQTVRIRGLLAKVQARRQNR